MSITDEPSLGTKGASASYVIYNFVMLEYFGHRDNVECEISLQQDKYVPQLTAEEIGLAKKTLQQLLKEWN
jgi:hypothetical protein